MSKTFKNFKKLVVVLEISMLMITILKASVNSKILSLKKFSTFNIQSNF